MEKFKFFASLTASNTNPNQNANTVNIKREVKRIKLQRRLRSESRSSVGSSIHDSGSDEENQRPDIGRRRSSNISFNQSLPNPLNYSFISSCPSSLNTSDQRISASHLNNNDNNNDVVINNELNNFLTNNDSSTLSTSIENSQVKFKRITRKIGKLMLPKLFQQQQIVQKPNTSLPSIPFNDANNNSSTDESLMKPKIGKIRSVFLQQVQTSEQESENMDSGKENYDSGNKSGQIIARQASFKSLDPSKTRVTPPVNRKVYKYFGVNSSSTVDPTSNEKTGSTGSSSGMTHYFSPLPLTSDTSSHYLSFKSPTMSPLLDDSVSRYVEQQTPQRNSIKRSGDKVTSTPMMKQVRRRILERYNSSRPLSISTFEEISIDESDLIKVDSSFKRLYLNYFPEPEKR